MELKYHYSLLTGDLEKCNAMVGKCPYGGEEGHFSSYEEGEEYRDRANRNRMKYEKIISKEPEITEMITRASNEFSKFVGLEFRRKSLKRALEKVLNPPPHKKNLRMDDLYDLIRYTQILPNEKYKDGVDETLNTLKKKGISVKGIRNAWETPCGYRGLNLKLETKEGIKFELQFHTDESFEAKQKAHYFYEEMRSPSANMSKKRECERKMAEIFDAVPIPANAKEISIDIS